jgi:hypothetical protein
MVTDWKNHPDFSHWLLAATILGRRIIGGPPYFRGEFIIEDFVWLMVLTSGLVPLRFKPLVSHIIVCTVSTTIALLGLGALSVPKDHSPPSIVPALILALFAALSAVRIVIELWKLRKDNHPMTGTDRIVPR